MKKSDTAMHYEPDADVLSWELSNEPIDSAREVGNVIVHFSKENVPVLIEVLDAKKFLAESQQLMRNDLRSHS